MAGLLDLRAQKIKIIAFSYKAFDRTVDPWAAIFCLGHFLTEKNFFIAAMTPDLKLTHMSLTDI